MELLIESRGASGSLFEICEHFTPDIIETVPIGDALGGLSPTMLTKVTPLI
jgi:hypothetical protein